MSDSPAEYADQAVREHQILIASELFRYESYYAPFNVYVRANVQTISFLQRFYSILLWVITAPLRVK